MLGAYFLKLYYLPMQNVVHPKLDLVTTWFSELYDLVNKTQLPSYFIVYQYSI